MATKTTKKAKLGRAKTQPAQAVSDDQPTTLVPAQPQPPEEGEIVDPGETDIQQDKDVERGMQLLSTKGYELALVGGVSTDQLRRSLEIQTEQRALIKAFIQHHLVEGIDYGQIHVVKDCPDKYGKCKRDYHYSKRVLFKPGQEKIFSLFGITDTLERDAEAYEMLGAVPGLVAYKCTLFRGDKEVGHGRGAASVGEQGRNANSTIKIAEKRARMDACLSLGFSEYFAQDLDDPDYKTQAEQANQRAAAEAAARDKDDLGLWKRDPALAMDNEERTMLFRMIKRIGIEQPDSMLEFLNANGLSDPKGTTSGVAREFMRKLAAGDYTPIPMSADPVMDTPESDADIAAGLGAAIDAMDAKPEPQPEPEPELVVDTDLKTNVMDMFTNIGLNQRGQMWLMKKICGRPFVQFHKLTDNEWRRAYNMITSIMDNQMDVPDVYISKPDYPMMPVDFSESSADQTQYDHQARATAQ